ncbi:hypothetical protein SAMN05216338_10917 [Bradyrhizobium sp. Rc2d]|nr:hypothetical protein SAMN05216338_10917 [Bradyrhizobium sp. Rc2d]
MSVSEIPTDLADAHARILSRSIPEQPHRLRQCNTTAGNTDFAALNVHPTSYRSSPRPVRCWSGTLDGGSRKVVPRGVECSEMEALRLMSSCHRASKREWPALALKWDRRPAGACLKSGQAPHVGFDALHPLWAQAKSGHQASTTAGTSCSSSASESSQASSLLTSPAKQLVRRQCMPSHHRTHRVDARRELRTICPLSSSLNFR